MTSPSVAPYRLACTRSRRLAEDCVALNYSVRFLDFTDAMERRAHRCAPGGEAGYSASTVVGSMAVWEAARVTSIRRGFARSARGIVTVSTPFS